MAKLVVNSESLVSVADAIREKGGTNASLEFPNGFVDAVGAIESGGGESLPDWNDDSPIVASGYGHSGQTCRWEVTEKGTLRWVYDANGTAGSATHKNTAGWGNSTASMLNSDFLSVAHKVRQLDIGENLNKIYLGYMPNCERIRIKEASIQEFNIIECPNLKEIDYSDTSKITLCDSRVIETFELSPTQTELRENFAKNCFILKEINLENITVFNSACFQNCKFLKLDIVFNAGLTTMKNNVFANSGIKSAKFQNSLDSLPTIPSNVFNSCSSLTDIYCTWAEGAIANAPWGATNATIHYNSEV